MQKKLVSQGVTSPFLRIARNAGSILLSSASGEALTSYAIALAAISLGATGFGTLSAAQAFAEPFRTIAAFGLGNVVLTVAARRGGIDGVLRGTLIGITGAFSMLALGLVLLAGALTGRGGPLGLLTLVSIGMLLEPLTMAFSLPFQFEQKMHRLLAFPFLISIVRLGTAYVAVYFLNTVIGFQLSANITGLLSACLVVWAARRFYKTKMVFSKALAKDLLKLAWPIAVVEFVVMIYSRGSYLLLYNAGPRVQGEYAAADRLVRPVLALASALMVSSLPTMATLAAERNFKALEYIYKQILLRALQVLIPIGAIAFYTAPLLLRRFVPEYANAGTPFRILLVGVLCMFLNQLSSMFIIAMSRFRLIMMAAIVNFFVYLALATTLIPRYGATGAAFATTIMEQVNTVVQITMVFILLRNANTTPKEI